MIAAYHNLTGGIALLPLEGWAQGAIERVIHSLPEGVLIALFAWAVLRVLPKQNSRTRFAVWFVALLAVVGLACVGGKLMAESGGGISGATRLISSRISEIHLPAHWAGYLLVAWFFIASLALMRLAVGLWNLRALRRSCSPVNVGELDPALAEMLAATLQELNAARSFGSRRVTLATSERVRVPAALGLWSPMIVLPAWALAELPAEELSIILRHEFAHLRRWDDWTNLVQKIVRAVFFFHPAVWWIESRLSVEREMACDDIVVAETDNPMGYASCLVSLLERSLAQRGWTMAQAIVHRAREASERVAQILDKNRPAARGISKPALGLVGSFAALCLVMLPATPQFVAFDRETVTAPAEHQYLAGLDRSASLRLADYRRSWRPVGIAASLKSHVPVASGMKVSARKSARPVSPLRVSRSSNALVPPKANDFDVASDSASADLMPGVNVPSAVNAVADSNARPAMQRLLLVRETQFVTAEFPVTEVTVVALPRGPVVVWSVKMMRVTLVAPVWREMRMPTAKKI
jgi:beta-lactamase regulating signal transducer with metallopeptidase domain